MVNSPGFMPDSNHHCLPGIEECHDFPEPRLPLYVAEHDSEPTGGLTLDASRVAGAPLTWRSFFGFQGAESCSFGRTWSRTMTHCHTTITWQVQGLVAICHVSPQETICFVT